MEGLKKRPSPVPAHVKYRTRTINSGTAQDAKLRPSEMLATLTQAGAQSAHPEVPQDGPQIVAFLDLHNTTTQTNSSVEVGRPIFQPYPQMLKFPQYEPFGVYEQTLFFRNNDSVSRRIRVLPPESPYFEVIGPRSPVGLKELEHSKIGPGMEVCFIVKFRPQEVKDYKVDLVCVTEREKFLVPVRPLPHPRSPQQPPPLLFPTQFTHPPTRCHGSHTTAAARVIPLRFGARCNV